MANLWGRSSVPLSLFRLSEWTEHESGFGELGGIGRDVGGGLSGWLVVPKDVTWVDSP